MKKVLITGLTGYLGRHLKKHIDELGWEIFISNSKVANLMDDKNLHVYNDVKFDYIFHLAAHTKAGDYCLYHKGEQFEINQRINSNILKYWNDHQPQAKMIAMGTSCSYSPDLLMSEENYLIGQPDEGLYTYAMTKRMLLVGLKSYAEQYGLKYMYYVPSTLYGPKFELDDSHFIFDLIKKIYSGKNHGTNVELWGDGYQKRELVYVEDAIKIIMRTLHLENKSLNLGTGVEYSIREYANTICSELGYNDEIFYDTTKYVGVKSKRLDTTELFKLLPDFKFTTLKDGLTNTIKYYANEKEK
jgi:GDP-L-fucose synthase